MNITGIFRRFLAATLATAALTACVPALAQEAAVAGVWRTQEGTPSGMGPGVTSSDVQTLFLYPNGRYRREIVVEGPGAGGKIIDSGEYRFRSPNVLQYRRQSWLVCVTYCAPAQPIGANSGTLPFELVGDHQAIFLQLGWTKIQ
jgi:hypothetical protein